MNKIIYKESPEFRIGDKILHGEQAIPYNAKEIVIFSHGSGSSRFSLRNNYVADKMNECNIATLLVDLLTIDEDLVYQNRFDIDLLTKRLIDITVKISRSKISEDLNIGYFGASTGAASALNAAAYLGSRVIKAVVSRGGRPDLSMPVLCKIKSPVLLIVGELDTEVIKLNKMAYDKLKTEKMMKIIPGSSHLFDEPGKLDVVAELAIDWFSHHLKIRDSVPVGDKMYPYPWS